MPTFDTSPADLAVGAGHLAEDAAGLSGGCASAVEEARIAAGAVNGGPLAGALTAFAAEMDGRGTTMVDAIRGAGASLASNARRYVSDDESAHTSLMGTVPE